MSEVVLSTDPDSTNEAASRRLEGLVAASLEWRGACSVAFSVRPEAVGLFDRLVAAEDLWREVVVTQVDDRIGTSDRDWDLLVSRFMDPSNVSLSRRIPLPTSLDGLDDHLDQHAARLDDVRGERFSLDIAQLVLDADGGIGALRPGAPILDSTKRIDVAMAGDGVSRVGLTFASLQRSRTIVVVAIGEDKAQHVRHLARMDGRVPASQLRHVRIEVFADAAAGSLIHS